MAKAAKDLPKTATTSKPPTTSAAPAKATANKAADKSKQQFIPGTEPPSFKDLNELGQQYQETKLGRMQLLEEEVELKAKLQQLMHTHKLDYYAIPDTDLEIVLEMSEETVKVKRRKAPKDKGSETDFGDE